MTLQVPFNNFKRDPEELVQAVLAVETVLRSGWWILGDNVKSLKQTG